MQNKIMLALRYARWTCYPDGVVPRHATPPNSMPAGLTSNARFRSTFLLGVQLNRVQGPISDCGPGNQGKIYGFVHSPLKATNVNAASTVVPLHLHALSACRRNRGLKETCLWCS